MDPSVRTNVDRRMSADRDPARRPLRSNRGRPTHPPLQAFVLALAVVIAIVALALISTFGAH
jgi:hypothetical protein